MKTFSKGLIIFIIIFACIAFGITAALIVFKNNNTGIKKPSNTTSLEVDYNLGINDLTMKYWTNNLKTTEITHSEGGKVWLSQYYYPDKLSVNYYSIDGLKDEAVEKKVNEQIKDFAFSLVPTEEADSKQVTCYIVGNFSNILSLNFSSYYYVKNDTNYDYHSGKSAGITFDLTTGDVIKLKDCFVDSANINILVSNAVYKSLAWDEKYMWGVWNEEKEEYEPIDRSDLEERAFKAMHEINKGNYWFTVSDYSVTVQTDESWASINYEDVPDQIAIFNRFTTKESIFDGRNDEGREVYFGLSYASDKIRETSNFISIDESYYDYWDDKDTIERLISERLDAEEKYAQSNKDKVVLEVIGSGYYEWPFYDEIWRQYYYNMNMYNLESRSIAIIRAEMTKKYYEENSIRDKFFDMLRNGFNSMRGEVVYGAKEFFESLKEENPNISVVAVSRGQVLTYENIADNKTIYTLIAQDYDKLQSSTKLLNYEDLSGLDLDELNKSYNEIFARHGHDFANRNLKEYFLGFLWYTPEYGKIVSVNELNSIEQKNIETIRSRINELKK